MLRTSAVVFTLVAVGCGSTNAPSTGAGPGSSGCTEGALCARTSDAGTTPVVSAPRPPPPPPRQHHYPSGPTPTDATIEMAAFVVPPGGEVFKCQNFENPFGADVDIVESEHTMSTGSHHMFVFHQAGAFDDPLQSCSGLEYARYIHASQRPHQIFAYPDGMGRRLPLTDGLRIQVHYLNTTDQPVTAKVAVTLHTGTVTTYVGQLFMNTLAVSIPPRSAGSAGSACAVPPGISLLGAASHMHRSGTHFKAQTDDGRAIYETTEWSEPPLHVYTPPFAVSPGTAIQYHCDYQNDTDSTLTFGESAATNEMCIFSADYFPAKDGASIDCLF